MNYTLAKKLKDKGFDLNYVSGETYYDETTDTYLRAPTLSELIEACGNRFGFLRRNLDGRFSASDPLDNREHETEAPVCWCKPRCFVQENGNMAILHNELQSGEQGGSTPEEAVANLWLSLKNHE